MSSLGNQIFTYFSSKICELIIPRLISYFCSFLERAQAQHLHRSLIVVGRVAVASRRQERLATSNPPFDRVRAPWARADIVAAAAGVLAAIIGTLVLLVKRRSQTCYRCQKLQSSAPSKSYFQGLQHPNHLRNSTHSLEDKDYLPTSQVSRITVDLVASRQAITGSMHRTSCPC